MPEASFGSLSPGPGAAGGGFPARGRDWRSIRFASPAWTISVGLVAVLMAVPIVAIVVLALTASDDAWPHLVRHVLPNTTLQTVLLATGVGIISLVIGTATAWLITMYRFPGREMLDRLLVLPLAIPTYIVAYCYVELLDYGGPVQSFVRSAGGFETARDYAGKPDSSKLAICHGDPLGKDIAQIEKQEDRRLHRVSAEAVTA